jgi:hypothetical protein
VTDLTLKRQRLSGPALIAGRLLEQLPSDKAREIETLLGEMGDVDLDED